MTKKQRIIFSILTIWSFIHLILYFSGGKEEGVHLWESSGLDGNRHYSSEWHEYIYHTSQFFPFESDLAFKGYTYPKINRLEYYDITELLVYVVSAWLIFGLYKFIQKGK